MKKKKRKLYFGMSVSQIGILAGVALVGVIVIFVGIIFVFTSTTPATPASQIPATAAIETLVPSETPTVTAPAVDVENTPVPTPAPVIATNVPPGDWIEFKTQGAGVWLPPSFVGGDMTTERQASINKVSRLGKYYKNVTNSMKNADSETVLWMVDKTPKQTDVITTVTASHTVLTEDVTLDRYINGLLNGDVGGTPVAMLLTVNESKKTTLLGREARRLIVSSTFAGHGTIEVVYYIKDGANIWGIGYILIPDEYLDLLPLVEESIHTFNLTP